MSYGATICKGWISADAAPHIESRSLIEALRAAIVTGAKLKRPPGANPTGTHISVTESLAGRSGERKYHQAQARKIRMRKAKAEISPSGSPQDPSDFEQLYLPVQQQSSPEPLDNISLARPEQHMFLRPYFLLDKHADKTTGFETREVVTLNGKKIERRWCVKPDDEYGMPGPVERDVLLAVYEIAYENYISKRIPVPELMHIGSLRNFIKRLGMSYCGKAAAKVKLALKRLVHTGCKSENSFFDKSKNLFLTESFQLLRGVGITGESDGKGSTIEETYVIFDDRVRRNLDARYLMVLDLHLLRALQSDIAKHLYPLLSHWLWRSSQYGYWRVEYVWLAQHLGIKVWDKLWRAKQQLKDANEELKNLNYISDFKWDGWTLLYFPGNAFNGDQDRRANARENIQDHKVTAKAPIKKPLLEQHDALLPVLVLFAQGNWMAEARLKELGLTPAQAEALCLEKGIHLSVSR